MYVNKINIKITIQDINFKTLVWSLLTHLVHRLHLTWYITSYIKNNMAQLSVCHFSDVVQTAHYAQSNMNVTVRWQRWVIIFSIRAAITDHKFIFQILE